MISRQEEMSGAELARRSLARAAARAVEDLGGLPPGEAEGPGGPPVAAGRATGRFSGDRGSGARSVGQTASERLLGLIRAAGLPAGRERWTFRRGWVFDRAWPRERVAVVIAESADAIFGNAAAAAGWRLLWLCADDLADGTAVRLVRDALGRS